MSHIRVFSETAQPLDESADRARIAGLLEKIGVRFEQWKTDAVITPDMEAEQILAAYRDSIERLKKEQGYLTEDVVSLFPDHPDRAAMRKKFLDEHTHAEDEVRFFVDGRGLFYLHVGNRVYGVLCERGDLISVPAGTTHWFDMGPKPHFTAIRLFNNPEGWQAQFSGDDIASRFPLLEEN